MTEHIASVPENNHLRTPQFPFAPRRNGNHPYHSPRTQPQYQTAGARSTRMIIESASYETTPTESPPDEYHCVFNAQDCHHSVPSVDTLAAVDQSLSAEYLHNGITHGPSIHVDRTPPIPAEDVDTGTVTSKTGQSTSTSKLQTEAMAIETKKVEAPTQDHNRGLPKSGTEDDSNDQIETPGGGQS
ncbi:hypothetical protein B7463_g8559, partial [Scytalidium lignicola]